MIHLGLNIESVSMCKCYIRVNSFIVSHFHVAKGVGWYPQLLLQHHNNVEIMLDERNIINVELLSVHQNKCDIMTHYREQYDPPTHRILKINNFGPDIIYHSMCGCGIKCSFFGSDQFNGYERHMMRDYDVDQLHHSINSSKIKGVCRIISLFETKYIRDILIYIGMIMYRII